MTHDSKETRYYYCCSLLDNKHETVIFSPCRQTRGKVSREFHIYSLGMLDLAYIGFDQYQALFILKDK